mmetsp:Transcript_45850/g.92527  ORF Transcript_45850/g.92527 Transcript_45850/m.92527 type:complete len:216 (-) Transcript_45850:294-941(-)
MIDPRKAGTRIGLLHVVFVLASFDRGLSFCLKRSSTTRLHTGRRTNVVLFNAYDDFRSDNCPSVTFLSEENVLATLEEFIESDYGKQMFGKHPLPARIGVTGELGFVSLDGPEVMLSLEGAFWHKRSTVLGRAAMWLNACMPEIVEVRVAEESELEDEEIERDEFTGDVIFTRDRRSPDFNGDRATMEYQGIDPDTRGPFPAGIGARGGSMIHPA